MSKQRRSSRTSKPPVDHALLGHDVWYRGQVWRVVSAHSGETRGSPWLTLQRGLGVKALVKNHEIRIAFD